jgi:hypothetical protein
VLYFGGTSPFMLAGNGVAWSYVAFGLPTVARPSAGYQTATARSGNCNVVYPTLYGPAFAYAASPERSTFATVIDAPDVLLPLLLHAAPTATHASKKAQATPTDFIRPPNIDGF